MSGLCRTMEVKAETKRGQGVVTSEYNYVLLSADDQDMTHHAEVLITGWSPEAQLSPRDS